MTAREIFNLRARAQRIKAQRSRAKPRIVQQPAPTGYTSVREFAAARGLAESGIFTAIHKGKLPSIKVGRYRCIRPVDYDEYQKQSTENRAAAAINAHNIRSARIKERSHA